jgi:hypothetical protein
MDDLEQPEGVGMRLASLLRRLAAWTRCVALWFMLVLPFSPSVWAVSLFGHRCFTPALGSESAGDCMAHLVSLAPFYVLFGPIAHDEEEPPNPWPGVLLTALILAILFQWISTRMIWLRPQSDSD